MTKDEKEVALYAAFDDMVPFDPALPERNLLRAILLTALSDMRKGGEVQREATEFFSSEDEQYLFSFQSICNHLNVDANRVLMVAGLRKAPEGVVIPVCEDVIIKES